jgi:hypothetical protein
MELRHVNPIVDFIYACKFGNEEIVTEGTVERRNPPWPDFSMKGRTLKSVRRLVTAWHCDLAAKPSGQSISWRASKLEGHRLVEKHPTEVEEREWSIQELLDSRALHEEGRSMRHCVFS